MYAEMKDSIRNFKDEMNLKEMFERIHKLGEARDYVLETISNNTTKPIKSAKPIKPTKTTKKRGVPTSTTGERPARSRRSRNDDLGPSSGSSSSSGSSASSSSPTAPKEFEKAVTAFFAVPGSFTTMASGVDGDVCPAWFAMTGPDGSDFLVKADELVAFLEYVRRHQEEGQSPRDPWWPSKMVSAFMERVRKLLVAIPPASAAHVLRYVMAVLAPVANSGVVKAHATIGTIFTEAFTKMFRTVVSSWMTEDAATRAALYEAYKAGMVVSPTSDEKSFDFLLSGAGCFPPAFAENVPAIDMRSFADRYAECLNKAVDKFREVEEPK
jgi:hypothetical protein